MYMLVCIVVINTLEMFSVKGIMQLLDQRQECYRLIIPVCYMLPDIFYTLVLERMSSRLQVLALLAHYGCTALPK